MERTLAIIKPDAVGNNDAGEIIRRIHDDTLAFDRAKIEQVQAILRERFAAIDPKDVEQLPARLVDPRSPAQRF